MTKDYIYIKLCGGFSISPSNLKIKLINKYNKTVFAGKTDYFGKIRIPICNNEVYKLIIYSRLSVMKTSLIAKSNEFYRINVSDNKINKHLVTILLMDKYNPNIKIEGGKIILCQDIQFQ